MRLLLDTHALLWWLFDAARLPARTAETLASPENDVFVSSVSLAEIAIKLSLNKLPMAAGFEADLMDAVTRTGFTPLPLTLRHAYGVLGLPWHHRDPFDRLLVAQSKIERLRLVTNDRMLRRYLADPLW
jgi:PIN domain nuclease of toxin-antitoxin system